MCMRWPTVMHPTVIQTYDAPSSGMPSGLALQFTPVGLGNRKRLRVYTLHNSKKAVTAD